MYRTPNRALRKVRKEAVFPHLLWRSRLCEVMHRVETHGMPRRERRALLRRFRTERTRATPSPSPSAVWRYLSAFHDPHGAADRERTKRSFRLRASIFAALLGPMPIWLLSYKSVHHTSMRRSIRMRRRWRRIKPTRSFRTSIFARIRRSIRIGPSTTSCCTQSSAMATFRRDSSNYACSKTPSRCCR
jgi:hypothetical protein